MIKLHTIISFVFLLAIFPFASQAQIGWKQAVAGTVSNTGIDTWSAVMDPFGNKYVTGMCGDDSITFGAHTIYNMPNSGGMCVVVKIDTAGNFLWAFGSRNANTYAAELAVDPQGNVFVFGTYDSATCVLDTVTLINPLGNGHDMYFLMKLSAAGRVVWAQNVAPAAGTGAPLYEANILAVGADGAGNAYVSGFFDRTYITIGGNTIYNTAMPTSDIFLAKYGPSGNVVWAQGIGGNNTDWASGMKVTKSGNIYLSGMFISSTINIGSTVLIDSDYTEFFSAFLAKFDSNGTAQWAKSMFHYSIYGIATDSMENPYITGCFDATAPIGNVTLPDSGRVNFFIAKYLADGTFKWAKSAISAGSDAGFDIAFDMCGYLWVCGGMNTGTFAPIDPAYTMKFGSHVVTPPAHSGEPLFVAKYDTLGNYITSIALQSGGDDFANILMDSTNNLYICGDYLGSIQVGPDSLKPAPGVSGFQENLYVAKYQYDSIPCRQAGHIKAEVNTYTGDDAVRVYPNPASGEFTIAAAQAFAAGAKAELYNMAGRLVRIYPLYGAGQDLSLSGIAAGVYEVKIIQGAALSPLIRKLAVMK